MPLELPGRRLEIVLGPAFIQRNIKEKEFEDHEFVTTAAPNFRSAGMSLAEFEARRRRM
jgi:hypothetical protein